MACGTASREKRGRTNSPVKADLERERDVLRSTISPFSSLRSKPPDRPQLG